MTKKRYEKNLSHIPSIGNDTLLKEKIYQNVGTGSRRRIAEINERDAEKDIVEAGVQMRFEANEGNKKCFPQL